LASETKSNIFQWLDIPKLSLTVDYLTPNQKVLFLPQTSKVVVYYFTLNHVS